MACYLVTGGGGFIGSHIAGALLARGERVRILDNFSTGRRENLAALTGAEVVEGDIRSYHIVRAVVEGVDVVLHQAALPSVPRSVYDPITSNDVNVTGTLNVLAAARDAGVGRLVFASSSSVYGTNPELPKRETMLASPLSPYAVSKLAGESYCRAFTQIYGFETVALRYFNVFGPRQRPDSEYAAVIPRFITALVEGRTPEVHGDGRQCRDFTFVVDTVQANLRAARAPAERCAGRAFNVARGESHDLLELLAILTGLTGAAVAPQHVGSRPGDVRRSHADITAARESLGYAPSVSFAEGLARTVEWFKRSP